MVLSASGRVGCAGGYPTVGGRIVSAAGVQKAAAIISTPDDHFTTSPYCRVACPGFGRVGCVRGRPTIGARIVPPAGIQIGRAISPSSPNDHFATGPHCCMGGSGRRGVGKTRWSPRVLCAAS